MHFKVQFNNRVHQQVHFMERKPVIDGMIFILLQE